MARARLVIAVIVVAGIAAALVALAHLPPVRSVLGRRAAGWLLTNAGIQASYQSISYNLISLRFTVRDVVLAAPGSEATPFLRAEELSVSLPWSAVRGNVAARAIRAVNLHLQFVRRSDGSWNLPVQRESQPSSFDRFDIGTLLVHDGSVMYRDDVRDVAIAADGIAIDLKPRSPGVIAGTMVIGQGPAIRLGARESIASQVSGRVAFDGTALLLEGVDYHAPEGQVTLEGRLDSVFSRPRSDVGIRGTVSLVGLSPWLTVEPVVEGTLGVRASVVGTLSEPAARIVLESRSVSWRHLKEISLKGEALVENSGVTVQAATLGFAEGTIDTRGRLALDGSEGSVHFDWRGLSAARLLGPLAPVPVAAIVQGTMDIEWNGPGVEAITVVAENRSAPGAYSQSAVGVNGLASLRIVKGEWRLQHNHEIARAVQATGALRGRLSPEAISRSSVTGAVRVVVEDLRRLTASLRAAEIVAPAWVHDLGGRASADLQIAGSLGSPRGTGIGEVRDLGWANLGPGEMTFRLAADSQRLAVDGLEGRLGANHIAGSASVQFRSGALGGAAQFELSELALLIPGPAARWRPSGTLTGQVQLSGVVSDPTVTGTFQGGAMALAGQQIGALNGRLEYAGGQVLVNPLEVRQPAGGLLSAAGSFEPSTLAYTLMMQGSDLEVTPVGDEGETLPVRASLALEFLGEGTLEHPRGEGRVIFSQLSWRDLVLGPGDVGVELSDAGVHLDARLPELNSRVGGTVQISAPWVFNLAADVRDADLSALAGRGLIDVKDSRLRDVRGQASLLVTASGDFETLAESRIDIQARALEVQKGMLTLQLVRPATLQYERTRVTAQEVELRTGDTTISIAGGLGEALPGLQIQVRGDLRDVGAWLEAFDLAGQVRLQGNVDGAIRASGAVDRPTLAGDLTIGGATVQIRDLPPIDGVSLSAHLSDGVVELPDFDGRWQGAAVSGRASVPLPLFDRWLPAFVGDRSGPRGEAARLTLRVENLTAGALAAIVDTVPERFEGRASAVLELRADALDVESLTGELTVEQLDANVAGVALTQTIPTRLEVMNGRVRVTDWIWDASGNRVAVSGEASLAARTMNLALIGVADLRMIGGFVPGTATGGTAEVDVRLSGPLGAPRIDGGLRLSDGELQSVNPQIVLSGVGGRVVLEGTRLRFVDVVGSVNGGPFTLGGELRHEGFRISAGRLDFAGRQIALNVPEGFRTEVDAELVLSFEAGNPRLTGRAAILRGAYREPISLAAGLLGAARRRPSAAGRPDASWLDRLDLNVAITSAEDLVVDNNYGRLDLGLDVRLVGSVGRPAIVGRAEIREGGALYLGGRAYQVESGVIDFQDPNEIRPDLNITARTRVARTDITLTITGTPDALQGELSSSDPDLTQRDMVSLLVTGRLASEVGGAETTIAREQLIGLLSGEVLGFAAQAVGLDTLRLERGAGQEELRSEPSLVAGETDPASRLTLSKSFSRYAEVVLSQDLRESGSLTWIFAVTPRRGLELRAVARDDLSRSYEIRHDLSFGRPGGSPRPPQAARAADREARVAEVRFVGDLGVPVLELESLLQLQAGDRFDFYRWQRDRERLRQFYLDRAHFEARVTARRENSGEPKEPADVVLEYAIRQGPKTILRVEGYSLPDRVIRELETLWSNAVFEEVLFRDLQRRIRSYLLQGGYPAAEIAVARDAVPTDAEKSIRVVVTAGTRTASRAVVFRGNDIIPTSRLEALVSERDLSVAAWIEPAVLVRAVQEVYEEAGLLAATVEVEPPELTADRATISVRIAEGVRFTILDVFVAGAARRSEADVREAFGLEPGQPFIWQDVDAGRREVEAGYRREGFNSVRTVVEEDVDRAQSGVRLTLRIEEGAQQVLQAVEVEGGTGIRPESLSRALALESGEAVDLASWQQARRRLLDTGLFRSVDIEAVPIETVKPGEAGTQPVAARVTLDRWPLWRLRYGFEIFDELGPLAESRVFGPGLTADLQRRTVWGRPLNVGTAFRLTRDERIGRVFLSAPNFFTLPLSTTLFVSTSREKISEGDFLAFVTDRTLVTAEQRFRRGRSLQFAYGYQYERDHTFDPNADPNNPLRLELRTKVARLTFTGLVDRRDDPFDAIHGLMHSSTFGYGPKALGSEVRFIKYFAQQLYFRPLGAGVISASAFRFGVGRGLSGQELFLTERFYAGGANTVRGYREESLGGVDFLGTPIGGEALVVFNQEARFPIYRWLRGVGFLDAGNVFPTAGALSLTDLKASVGAGLRLATPVGMFRVDLGFPLSLENGRRTPRWYFSLGQMF